MAKRRSFSDQFKAAVAREAQRWDKTVQGGRGHPRQKRLFVSCGSYVLGDAQGAVLAVVNYAGRPVWR